MSIWKYANPAEFMRVSGAALPWVAGLAIALMALGVGWSLFFTPEDYQQGQTVKILFIHVPAAIQAINGYLVMVVASLIGLIRRHHVSFLVAKAAAPIGAGFTLLGLFTGAVWGEPMWGTWWVWDARLTSFLILFFFYLGYMALWAAIDDPEKAADLSAVLCLVGGVFAILSRYAVQFWATLHQGTSISLSGNQKLTPEFLYPLVVMLLAFLLTFLALLIVRTRTEIRLRRARAIRLSTAEM